MNWIKVILFNTLITIILTEVTLRYIYTPTPLENRIMLNVLAKQQDIGQRAIYDYANMRYKPHTQSSMNHAEYKIETSHDKLGFRNPCAFPLIQEKNYNLIIGDSFAYGTGLPDEHTYGCLLKNEKNKYYILAIPGLNVPNYLMMLKANISRIRNNIGEPKKTFLVLFLGNDFESLVNYGLPFETQLDPEENLFRKFLKNINYYITKQAYINESYFFVSIKLILKPLLLSSDKGDFILNYSGSSFYKKAAKKPIRQVERSISKIKYEFDNINQNLDGIFLIEDPAMLSSERLKRDLSIAGALDISLIDVNFKIQTILKACENEQVNCFDTRPILSGSDYYVGDNHLNPDGAKKIAQFISANANGH